MVFPQPPFWLVMQIVGMTGILLCPQSAGILPPTIDAYILGYVLAKVKSFHNSCVIMLAYCRYCAGSLVSSGASPYGMWLMGTTRAFARWCGACGGRQSPTAGVDIGPRRRGAPPPWRRG